MYNIPVRGLQSGLHHFEFDLDKSFFKHFEESLIEEGHFKVKLDLDKHQDHNVLVFSILGKIKTNCDRCLAEIELPVKAKQTIILKTGDGPEDDPELVYMHEDAHEFNVAKLIYEYVCLSVPIIKAYDCEKEKNPPCDQNVLAYFKKEEKNSDSGVWDVLKNIKDFD